MNISYEMNHLNQIPATKLPREIHFKSDKGEIEAFVCRDAQEEDMKSAPLQGTSGDDSFKQQSLGDSISENGVIEDYLEEDSFGKLLRSANSAEIKSPSPKLKKNQLDLSPDFFMTSNEINGKLTQ